MKKLDKQKIKENTIKVFNKIKKSILDFLKKNGDVLLMNIIIFILTVFVISSFWYNVTMKVWLSCSLLFIIVPTIVFTIIRKMPSKKILISYPFLYLLFLMFLNYCTIRQLYGISTLSHDLTPNFVDALLVVFIFGFIEYVTCALTNLARKIYVLKLRKSS